MVFTDSGNPSPEEREREREREREKMNESTFRFSEYPRSMKARLESMGLTVQMIDDHSGIVSDKWTEIPFENLDQLRRHLREWVDMTLKRIEED